VSLSPPAPARPPEPPPLLPLADALAVPAGWLAAGRVPSAALIVDAQGIAVQTAAVYGPRLYRWADLAAQARALADDPRAWPSERAALDPEAFTRWPVLLRLVGRLLDRQRVRACVIHARVARSYAPLEWSVRVTAGNTVLLDSAAVRRHLRRLRLTAGGRPQAALAVERAVLRREIAGTLLRPAQHMLAERLRSGIPRPRGVAVPPPRDWAAVLAALRQRAPRLACALPDVCAYMLPAGSSALLARAKRWLHLEPAWLGVTLHPPHRAYRRSPALVEGAVLALWQTRLLRLRGLLGAVARQVCARG
jgi:hypothetical protein